MWPCLRAHGTTPRHTNPSQWLAALYRVRHLCTRAAAVMPHATAPGSLILIDAIRSAIDDYAEREMGAPRILLGAAAQRGVTGRVLINRDAADQGAFEVCYSPNSGAKADIVGGPGRANSSHGTHPELEATVAEESATDVA